MTWEMLNLFGSASLGAVMQIVGAKANAQAEMMKQLTANHKLEEEKLAIKFECKEIGEKV